MYRCDKIKKNDVDVGLGTLRIFVLFLFLPMLLVLVLLVNDCIHPVPSPNVLYFSSILFGHVPIVVAAFHFPSRKQRFPINDYHHHHRHHSQRQTNRFVSPMTTFLLPSSYHSTPYGRQDLKPKTKDHNRRRRLRCETTMMLQISNEDRNPPEAYRDENSFLHFGGWTATATTTSSSSTTGEEAIYNNTNVDGLGDDSDCDDNTISTTCLPFSRKISIPNPYGWMRDDTRTKKHVLEYIQQENEYSESIMATPSNWNLRRQLIQEYQQATNGRVTTFSSSKNNLESNDNKGHNENDNRDFDGDVEEEHDGKLNVDPLGNIFNLYSYGPYYYYTRRVPDLPFPIHCRMKKIDFIRRLNKKDEAKNTAGPTSMINSSITTTTTPTSIVTDEEIVLDENFVAEYLKNMTIMTTTSSSSSSSSSYMAIHSVVPSPSHTIIAFSCDVIGNEAYDLYLYMIDTRKLIRQNNLNNVSISGTIIWKSTPTTNMTNTTTSGTRENKNDDDLSLFVVTLESKLNRPYQLVQCFLTMTDRKYGMLFPTINSTKIIFEERNENYWGGCRKTMDGKYLLWQTYTSNRRPYEIWSFKLYNNDTCIKDDNDKNLILSSTVNATNAYVEHQHGFWWLVSNHDVEPLDHDNDNNNSNNKDSNDKMRLYRKSANQSTQQKWSHIVLPFFSTTTTTTEEKDPELEIDSIYTFPRHLVLQGRYDDDGLSRIFVAQLNKDSTDDDAGNDDTVNTTETSRMVFHSIKQLQFNESAHYISMARPQDYESETLIICYESMITPPQIIQINLKQYNFNTTDKKFKRSNDVLHEQKVVGYDKEKFDCQRLKVPSRDGTCKIPISVVYRKDTMNKKFKRPSPVHLLGYGSYGHSLEPSFSIMRLPLLKRGFICIIAHVRGGGELGNRWYESGRLLNKNNSINDFVDVAKWLVGTDTDIDIDKNNEKNHTNNNKNDDDDDDDDDDERQKVHPLLPSSPWTDSTMLVCEGRSAGGLLVAAATNQEPSLFRCVFLGVPFLDVIESMTDVSLPLTTLEYEEWGNPIKYKHHFDNILSYSPIQNIKKYYDLNNNNSNETKTTTYPSILVMGGLYDTRVPYWESLKYIATIRHAVKTRTTNAVMRKQSMSNQHQDRDRQEEEPSRTKNTTTIDNHRPLCVKILTDSGHSMGNNQTKYFDEMAFVYAFLIHQVLPEAGC